MGAHSWGHNLSLPIWLEQEAVVVKDLLKLKELVCLIIRNDHQNHWRLTIRSQWRMMIRKRRAAPNPTAWWTSMSLMIIIWRRSLESPTQASTSIAKKIKVTLPLNLVLIKKDTAVIQERAEIAGTCSNLPGWLGVELKTTKVIPKIVSLRSMNTNKKVSVQVKF